MAAHSNNFIRVRLHFDYPPPAVVDCRMCWLLVDLNTCRVVADLESIIREKFEFSRRSILSLFVEECYLPHTESIYVVRDNDSVRVKVDYLAQANGGSSHLDKTSDSCRKRHRPTEDDGLEENGLSVEWKKKKRKKTSEESLEKVKKQDSANEKKKSHEKCTEKKKSKKDKSSTVTPKPAAPIKNSPVRVKQTVKSKKSQVKDVSSSDSGSSSEEDKPPKKTAAPKSAPKTPSSTLASSKAHSTSKPTQKKPAPPSSSSDSSSDEDTGVIPPPKTKPSTNTPPKAGISNGSQPQQTPPALHSSKPEQQQAAPAAAPPRDQVNSSSTSSSEEEIPFVIRRPLRQPDFGVRNQSSCRGHGRGNNWRGGRGERRMSGGRGGSRGQSGSMQLSCNGAKEPSYQTDSLANTSVVLQNGAESAPKKDYSSMPLLAAPPQVGQRIAFKLLELTENYTPEVSEYKEGKIVSYDPTSKQIELELHSVAQAPVEPGKFDLVYQNPDGTERVEYAVSRDSRVTERWESLLEPRLII